jgi:hypothetical protein
MQSFRYLAEKPDNPFRLGRHQVHDALLPERDARTLHVLNRFRFIQTVTHRELVPCFDQGDLGSCTANAALGCMMTEPFAAINVTYGEPDCVKLYEAETKLDDSQIPGEYPPNDTGSTGSWSMMALEQQGVIKSYHHTRSLFTALRLLNRGPVSVGVTWYESMFTPTQVNTSPDGDTGFFLNVDEHSEVAGGHQVCVTANDVEHQRVLIRNSWGTTWGDQGHAWLTWNDLDLLLHEGGDVVQPMV